MSGRKVPNRSNSAGYHQIGDGLRIGRGGSNHPHQRAPLAHEIREKHEWLYFPPVNPLADLIGVDIESRHNLNPVAAKLLVPQQCAPQTAGASQNRILRPVPTQEVLNPPHQLTRSEEHTSEL